MPLMVTGGVRRKEVAERVVSGSVSMVGLATALAIKPALPRQWMAGRDVRVEPIVVRWKSKTLASDQAGSGLPAIFLALAGVTPRAWRTISATRRSCSATARPSTTERIAPVVHDRTTSRATPSSS